MLLENDLNRLRHIRDAAREVLQFAGQFSEAEIAINRPLQALMAHNLQIIGEASARLTRGFRSEHPEIPWKKIIGMRNRIVHDYFDLDMDIIYSTVKQFLPELLFKVEDLLREQ
ncbi:MAG: DUF86 domain-containing protein [Candidatus Hydrogenedentes bacterium]|nr:DUF86 domain-containing protein [Candidatus Hydrogenedentota bacterium]MBI3117717.1 DUF86 domain-containing protein [Candidatus Hydrogenedentota bacterium]